MLLAEVKNPNRIRLTKSDTDGIFLHFDNGENQAGIRLDNPDLVGSSVMVKWAEQQIKASETKHNLLDACEKVLQYRKTAEKGQFKGNENAHEYWESVMSYVEEAVEQALKDV